MASIGSVAHIRLQGFDKEGIDSRSPLEDQAALTYKAARHYAQVNGFEPHVHRGVPGVRGQMVMKRITDTLFEDEPDKDERSKINGLVTQVLRKTDAAVCVRRPAEGDRESIPEWFIADRMPTNLTIVALNHKHRDPIPQAKPLVATHTEKRLTAHEVGEDREPADVTVRFDPEKLKNLKPEARDAFMETAARIAEQHAAFREEVYRVIAEHAPIGSTEVKLLLADQTSQDSSATVNAVRELAEAGRIVSRTEEDPERLIRGGGAYPKGKRMQLWGPAPGPVPPRRELPPGIQPRRSAQAWDDERRARVDSYADAILEVLNAKVERGGTRVRSRIKLTEAAGLTPEQFEQGITHLLKLELVYERNYNYFLAERAKDSTRKLDPVQPSAVHQPAPADTVPPAPPAGVDTAALVGQIHAAIDALAGRTDAGEVERLREQNGRLTEENEKLARQVRTLRAAMAALNE